MILDLLKTRLLQRMAIRQNVTFSPDLHVGPRSVLWAPRHLEIGKSVYIGKNVTIEVDGSIGDGVLVANNVGIIGRTDHDMSQVGSVIRHSRWVGDAPDKLSQTTSIGSDVWIGFGAIVLSGVSVGDSSVIAAGALVTSDVPPNTVVAGAPARRIRDRFDQDSLQNHWDALSRAGTRLNMSREGHVE
jgi:acetyltransferase-like isoleucine patch superfamily enzyme